MKLKALTLFVGLAVAALAVQDPLTLSRTYKEGEKDTYKMLISANLPIGTAEMSMNMTQTVKKVYDNGDADIETLVADMKLVFGGNEMPTGPNGSPPARTQRMDKFGRPVGTAEAGTGGMMDQMSFMRYAMFTTDKALVAGSTIDVDEKNEKAGTHTWGKVKLEKIENGVATVQSDLQMTTKQTGDKAMNLKFTSQVETANAKLKKVDGQVTNLPAGDQGVQVDSVQISVERLP